MYIHIRTVNHTMIFDFKQRELVG